MSSVLIGIIGVILFIGLALAGALFLGPRFQASSNSSKASAISQSLSQTTQAVNLYALEEGSPLPIGSFALLTSGGYMKSRPMNVMVREASGGNAAASPSELAVITSRVETSAASDDVCREFSRQVGMNDGSTLATLASVPADRRAGCFRNTADLGGEPAGTLIYFMRI